VAINKTYQFIVYVGIQTYKIYFILGKCCLLNIVKSVVGIDIYIHVDCPCRCIRPLLAYYARILIRPTR